MNNLPVADAQDLAEIIHYLDYFNEQPRLQFTITGTEISGKGIDFRFEITVQSEEQRRLFKKFLVDYARTSFDAIMRNRALWDAVQ